MIDLHDKALLLRSFEIGFHPFIRGFSVPTPWVWYASLFAKPRGKYQPLRANSKICYKVGDWQSSPPLQRETAATGPSFLAPTTATGRPDHRIQHIHGPLGCWFELVFRQKANSIHTAARHNWTRTPARNTAQQAVFSLIYFPASFIRLWHRAILIWGDRDISWGFS